MRATVGTSWAVAGRMVMIFPMLSACRRGHNASMTAETTLTQDLPCAGCGYDLRGLTPPGKCPECGFDLGQSIRAFRLHTTVPADPRWLSEMLVAVRFALAAFAISILISVTVSISRGAITQGDYMWVIAIGLSV